MQWLKKLFGSSESTNVSGSTAAPERKTLRFPTALKEHAAELDKHLTAEIKKRVLFTWREYIDRDAHDYADLVARDPKSHDIARLEAETIMQAYLCGYMAQQRWIEEIEALQVPSILGRRLRHEIRAMGVSLDQNVSANLGTDMTKALQAVLKLGMDK